MNYFFTICSNNYLAQAIVLGNSLRIHEPNSRFIIVLVDTKSELVNYDSIPFEVAPIQTLEPCIDELSSRYNIIELNTCVKPKVIEYLFEERKADQVIYLDPDTRVYSSFEEVRVALSSNIIILTPHIYTPIPLDNKTPNENLFLNYGIYNLGFIALAFSEETRRFLTWWKERTYALGYSRVCEGIFVDQLYINLVPLLFRGVHVLNHRGYNMACWNFHERYLTWVGDNYKVNNIDVLRFFHFSSIKIDEGDLPILHHSFNRFTISERTDLIEIYKDYVEELKKVGYFNFKNIKCEYVVKRERQLNKNTSSLKRLLIKILPARLLVLIVKLKKFKSWKI